MLIAMLAQPQRARQRQAMPCAGLFLTGRHDPDVVGKAARNLLQNLEPGRMDAIVIGEENAQGGPSYFGWSFVSPPI